MLSAPPAFLTLAKLSGSNFCLIGALPAHARKARSWKIKMNFSIEVAEVEVDDF